MGKMSMLVVPCTDKKLILPAAQKRSCCIISCHCLNLEEKSIQEPNKNIQFTTSIDRPDSV